MKKMLFTTLIALPALGWAQGGDYILNGKIGALNAPAKAYLNYASEGKNQLDSTDIINGAFQFKGNISGPKRAALIIDHSGAGLSAIGRSPDAKAVYLEKGTISITGKDSARTAVVAGLAINKENDRYTQFLAAPSEEIGKINAEYMAASPEMRREESFQKSLGERYEEAMKKRLALQEQYIQQNPSSFFSLVALRDIGGSSMDISKVEPLYKSLSEDLRSSADGKEFAKLMDKERATSIGSLAPDFTQNDINEKPVKLSDFRGKYVLLDFWASWCGPCRQENPNVVEAFNKFKDKNFTVLGVSLDQPGKKDAWLAAIEKDGLTWTHVSDLKYWDNEVAKMYGVRGIPQNYLIDPNGKIVGKNLRGEALEQKLAEVITN